MQPAQIEQNRRDLAPWAQAKTRWTIGEIADYVTECGSHFFTRESMKFWGDTRANFGVVHVGGRVFITRKRKGSTEAGRALPLGGLRELDRARGCIGVELSESEVAELYAAPVPVLFRADKRGQFKDSVTAVFPTLPGSPGMLTCYAHIGQHGSCSKDWLRDTRAAKPDEFAALKRELESAPFHYRLRVVERISAKMDAERMQAEKRV